MSFEGFSRSTRDFFVGLRDNNSRTWFEEHRDWYETGVREPAEAFIGELGPKLAGQYPGIRWDTRRNGAGSLMRINRDIRFSPDKRPYKVNLGIIFWMGDGAKVESPSFYFHVDGARAFFFGGQHLFPKDTLSRYRQAVADDSAGGELVRILKELDHSGLPLFEEPAYKRVPRGYPPDHTRADLLRLGGIGVARVLDPDVIAKPGLVTACERDAELMQPLMHWLAALVRK